ncbi:MAG: T9SS type A sorting domain-containing protein [Sphingobacteriales bacterium]|nr:T9SS type A sorting domain-containing protein [Sphingobacteriales bacterium]
MLDSIYIQNDYPNSNNIYIHLLQHNEIDNVNRSDEMIFKPLRHILTINELPDGIYTVSVLDNGIPIKTFSLNTNEVPTPPPVTAAHAVYQSAPNVFEYCKGSPADTLYAQGENIKWYKLGSFNAYEILAEGNMYVPASNVQEIYVSQTVGGWESDKMKITLKEMNLSGPLGDLNGQYQVNCKTVLMYRTGNEINIYNPPPGICSYDGIQVKSYDIYRNNELYKIHEGCGLSSTITPIAVEETGTYHLVIHVENEYGCKADEITSSVTINNLPPENVADSYSLCENNAEITVIGENIEWYETEPEPDLQGNAQIINKIAEGNTFTVPHTGSYGVSRTMNGMQSLPCFFTATLQSPNYDPFNPNDCYKQQLADIAAGGVSSIGNISIGDAAVTFPPSAPNYADMTKEDGGGKQGSLASVPTSRRFSIVPNPVEDVAILRLPADMEVELRLWSAAGKLLWEQQKAADGERITMADLAAGVYYVELRSASGVYSMKLVKIDK